MSNDNKTLADAQPGGRVRLGDRMTIEKRARELLAVELHKDFGPASAQYVLDGNDDGCTAMRAIIAALSAQPSPGGQGDGVRCSKCKDRGYLDVDVDVDDSGSSIGNIEACPHCALAARQPVGDAITVEAVATVRRNGDGDRYIDWLTEGGIADLEVGDVLMVSDRAITDEDGSGEVYAAPPAQAVDPADPWRGLYSPDLMPKLDGVNQYHVAHPDLPEWPKAEDEERGIGPLVTAQGFAMAVVFGEYPDDDSEEVDYCAWLASWTPDAPAGADWRRVCIQDTEDGPAAFYVRPLALIDGKAASHA